MFTVNVWNAADVTTFTDAFNADLVAAGGSKVKIGPETAITLPDGTAATMAKADWTIAGYPAETLGYGMKKGDKYVTANVTTVALLVPYDATAFSEILNTITFTK